MCMIVDEAVTKKVQARLKRGSGLWNWLLDLFCPNRACFWKTYNVGAGVLVPAYFYPAIKSPGIQQSSRTTKSYPTINDDRPRSDEIHINRGFHVWLTNKNVPRGTHQILVPVWCKASWFVAGGHWTGGDEQAVFTHIEIKPADFAKAVGSKA